MPVAELLSDNENDETVEIFIDEKYSITQDNS